MNIWKREIWGTRQTPLIRMQKSVLLMDSYAAHVVPSVLSSFQRHYNTKCGIVPGGMTPLLQGIDVHINKPLKDKLKTLYKTFMRSKEVEYTRGGNKKGPSYQMLVDWCSSAWSELDPELIKRSFSQTGVSNTGSIDRGALHSKLRKLVVDGSMYHQCAVV